MLTPAFPYVTGLQGSQRLFGPSPNLTRRVSRSDTKWHNDNFKTGQPSATGLLPRSYSPETKEIGA